MLDSASSAPARSIEATARSISPWWMICSIGSLCTSTSYIERSIVSGFSPWLIVRLPCGSRSTASTLLPFSANATARFRVEVVFATPPFWLANAMTLPTVAPLEVDARACGRSISLYGRHAEPSFGSG